MKCALTVHGTVTVQHKNATDTLAPMSKILVSGYNFQKD